MRTSFDVLIIGGGPAGCVLANKLSRSGAVVGLLEAGPDYGTLDSGAWPEDLLDGRGLTWTHNWSQPESADVRGKVIGGGSPVNGCWSPRASAGDFDTSLEQRIVHDQFDRLPAAVKYLMIRSTMLSPRSSTLHREREKKRWAR